MYCLSSEFREDIFLIEYQGDSRPLHSRRIVMLGDFNALSNEDYSEERLHQITEVRAKGGWELPQFSLMSSIKQVTKSTGNETVDAEANAEEKFDDEEQDDTKTISDADNLTDQTEAIVTDRAATAHTSAMRQTQTKVRPRSPAASTSSSLGFLDCRHIAHVRTGPLSTCRFDTRIDYILLTPALAALCRVQKLAHIIAIPDVTDHNLVAATLKFGEEATGGSTATKTPSTATVSTAAAPEPNQSTTITATTTSTIKTTADTQNETLCKGVPRLKVGSFNVHQFLTRGNTPTKPAVLKVLKESNVDILALQECSRSSLDSQFLRQLGDEWHVISCFNCAIFSKLPLKDRMRKGSKIPMRMCWGEVTVAPTVKVEIVCVHFDYRKEPTRERQLCALMDQLEAGGGPLITDRNVIVLGDFNALSQEDFHNAQYLNEITEIRRKGGWELPQFSLMQTLKGKPHTEAVSTSQPSAMQNPNTHVKHRGKNSSKKQKVVTKKKLVQLQARLNFIDCRQKAAQVVGPLSTCRYDTRIDYILLSPTLARQCRVQELEHVLTIPSVSDHNLVTASIAFEAEDEQTALKHKRTSQKPKLD